MPQTSLFCADEVKGRVRDLVVEGELLSSKNWLDGEESNVVVVQDALQVGPHAGVVDVVPHGDGARQVVEGGVVAEEVLNVVQDHGVLALPKHVGAEVLVEELCPGGSLRLGEGDNQGVRRQGGGSEQRPAFTRDLVRGNECQDGGLQQS